MATLTIDGRSVTADPDRTILEAARAAGMPDIPTLCWYPKLPIVGNCRICLVSVEGQPKLLPEGGGRDGRPYRVARRRREPQGRVALAAGALPGGPPPERRPGEPPQRVRAVRGALRDRADP